MLLGLSAPLRVLVSVYKLILRSAEWERFASLSIAAFPSTEFAHIVLISSWVNWGEVGVAETVENFLLQPGLGPWTSWLTNVSRKKLTGSRGSSAYHFKIMCWYCSSFLCLFLMVPYCLCSWLKIIQLNFHWLSVESDRECQTNSLKTSEKMIPDTVGFMIASP